MEVKSKVWLEKGGKLAFGIGKYSILKEIAKTGSINKAAKNLNMSYRHAWSYISSAEKRLGEPLLVKAKGGEKGGGAVLTDYAKNLIGKFERLEEGIREFTNKRFGEIFLK
ncbi:MAG: LysR family transcriptional regulator [Candidatus Omnitrophota bacterium]|nr:LysR family transcriptional regulator [Candidatus Omnitrophota bacterium]